MTSTIVRPPGHRVRRNRAHEQLRIIAPPHVHGRHRRVRGEDIAGLGLSPMTEWATARLWAVRR